jgi:membrane fusion protein (multidrug efflux system)
MKHWNTLHHTHLLFPSLILSIALSSCKQSQSTVAPPAPEVIVQEAKGEHVALTREWIGRLEGSTNVDIRARTSGYIDQLDFQEGRLVKVGDVLLRIDPRPLEAALAQADAELAKSVATQGKTEADEKRQRQLFESKSASEQDYVNALQANLASKASIAAHRAAQLQAKLNLEYATITSPVVGIVGHTDLSAGDFVAAGSSGAAVMRVSTVDPIDLYFSLGEKEYLQGAENLSRLMEKAEADRPRKAELIRADGALHPEKGWFVAIDRGVDADTGTIRITIRFPNPGNILRPGQFARARFVIAEHENAIVVPQRAVSELQGRSFVWVVDAEEKARQRPVTVLAYQGSGAVIGSGLAMGERFIVEGLQKVAEGRLVRPVKAASPPSTPPAAPSQH